MLRQLPRTLFPFLILAYSFCGCASRDDLADTQTAPAGPKLTAFRKVVAKYKQSPGDFASDKERYRYNDELKAVQDAFVQVPFDASRNRKEAEAVVRLWQSDLENAYSGELHRVLEIEILRIYSDIGDSE